MSAPLRIIRPDSNKGLRGSANEGEDFKLYLGRLLKMIPAEVVSLYLVGSGLIPEKQTIVLAIWAVICLAGVIAIKAFGTSDLANNIRPDWIHVAISSVAFVIWVYTLGGPFVAYNLYIPYIGSLLVLTWTFFVPIFYRGPIDT